MQGEGEKIKLITDFRRDVVRRYICIQTLHGIVQSVHIDH